MDKVKLIAAGTFFVFALVIPLLILIGGGGITLIQAASQQKDLNILSNAAITLILAGLTFLFFSAIAIFLLFQIKDVSWLAASLPLLFGTAYTTAITDVVPDLAPFITRVDDAAVMSLGAMFSYLLALKRDKHPPKWIIIPLAAAAAYTLFGGIFPSGLDELIVQGLAFLAYVYGITHTSKQQQSLPNPQAKNPSE